MGTGKPSAPTATKRSAKREPNSINIRDYPSMMSLYEKESLAAEAKLKAARQKKKTPGPSNRPSKNLGLV
jgi:hypothetical protein